MRAESPSGYFKLDLEQTLLTVRLILIMVRPFISLNVKLELT